MKKLTKRLALALVAVSIAFGATACTPAELIKGRNAESKIPFSSELTTEAETKEQAWTEAVSSDTDSESEKEKYAQTNFDAPTTDELLKIHVGEDTKVGNWGSYTVRNYATKNLYSVCMRISDVVKYTDNPRYIDSKIAEYNNASTILHLEEADELKDNLEYVLLEVDFYIPPTQKYLGEYIDKDELESFGIPFPNTIRVDTDETWLGEDGQNYIFTTNTTEFKKRDYSYTLGDKMHSQILFPMLKNTPTKYFLEASYASEQEDKYDKMRFYVS